jgi:hypothetical protein
MRSQNETNRALGKPNFGRDLSLCLSLIAQFPDPVNHPLINLRRQPSHRGVPPTPAIQYAVAPPRGDPPTPAIQTLVEPTAGVPPYPVIQPAVAPPAGAFPYELIQIAVAPPGGAAK